MLGVEEERGGRGIRKQLALQRPAWAPRLGSLSPFPQADLCVMTRLLGYVDPSDPRFVAAVLAIAFNPLFWNVEARDWGPEEPGQRPPPDPGGRLKQGSLPRFCGRTWTSPRPAFSCYTLYPSLPGAAGGKGASHPAGNCTNCAGGWKWRPGAGTPGPGLQAGVPQPARPEQRVQETLSPGRQMGAQDPQAEQGLPVTPPGLLHPGRRHPAPERAAFPLARQPHRPVADRWWWPSSTLSPSCTRSPSPLRSTGRKPPRPAREADWARGHTAEGLPSPACPAPRPGRGGWCPVQLLQCLGTRPWGPWTEPPAPAAHRLLTYQ
ncbi:phosphatidylethanolamine N-methyltransferase isoform X2 [Camelus ferus]|uniref:Phosphatidylethanolamine N-methyltransferase isoform X2 n=1 Tax=Camelus ferus TaxID=419612 RepID=A0A8B8UL26_CAMFR|nr:phosphatidylethanolamine N-methyltransferase isoform X2 [Camelus ferus]